MKPSETQQLCPKPTLSQVRTALKVAGVHGNGDDARATLILLASLKDRIEALRALLPNLARTIDFLMMPVPHFGAQWANARTPVRTRSSLVLPLQVPRQRSTFWFEKLPNAMKVPPMPMMQNRRIRGHHTLHSGHSFFVRFSTV